MGTLMGNIIYILTLKNKQQNCYSCKINSDDYSKLTCNGNQVEKWSQKHLWLILDNKFDFNKHIGENINKCNNKLKWFQDGFKIKFINHL